MLSKWPTSSELTLHLLNVLVSLGGEANSSNIDKSVISKLNLDKELLEKMRTPTRSEISYRLAWIRTKAKQSELIEKTSARGWRITPKGKELI